MSRVSNGPLGLEKALRGRADRRVRGPRGPAAERPGAGSTAATARRRTPEGEYDVTYSRTSEGRAWIVLKFDWNLLRIGDAVLVHGVVDMVDSGTS